ncbi:MAG: AI-2E family transporter [Actinomycetota bacterium]|nr:MAG: AI-2E family transporter [Actinomycetota bacterium]
MRFLPRRRTAEPAPPVAQPSPAAEVADAAVPPVPTASSDQVQFVAFHPRWLRRATVLVLLLVVAWRVADWLFGQVSDFLFLLLLAWLISIALEPFVHAMARRGMRRGAATAIALFALLLLALAFFAVLGGLLFTQVSGLITSLPSLINDVVTWVNDTFHTTIDPQQITDQLNLTPEQIASLASNVAGGFFGIVTSIVGVAFNALTVLVFAFYFSADGPRLRQTIASWLPPRQQRVFVTVWEIAVVKAGGFVISRAGLAVLSAAFHALFFLLIDVPYWLPMGLFAGITSQFIPTIGTYLGIAVPALFAAFDDPIDVVWIVLFATVYQQVENYIFTPRVSRATMNIHPAIALGSVFVGAAIFGVLGALIGIPIAAAVIAVIETYGRRYDLVPELATVHEEVAAAASEASATATTTAPTGPD